MAEEKRPSLSTDLETRYEKSTYGDSALTKKTLNEPHKSPVAGVVIDATSLNGDSFQSPNGFEVKVIQGITQLKDAQSSPSKQLSRYMIGFDNRRYFR